MFEAPFAPLESSAQAKQPPAEPTRHVGPTGGCEQAAVLVGLVVNMSPTVYGSGRPPSGRRLGVGVELERETCHEAGGAHAVCDGVNLACPTYHWPCGFDVAGGSPLGRFPLRTRRRNRRRGWTTSIGRAARARTSRPRDRTPKGPVARRPPPSRSPSTRSRASTQVLDGRESTHRRRQIGWRGICRVLQRDPRLGVHL